MCISTSISSPDSFRIGCCLIAVLGFGPVVAACGDSPQEDQESIPCQNHEACPEDRICLPLGYCGNPWAQQYRLEVGPLMIPPTTNDGKPWEVDGSEPDFHCHAYGLSLGWDCFLFDSWKIECLDHLYIWPLTLGKTQPFEYNCFEIDDREGPDAPNTSRLIGSFCFDAECGPVPISILRSQEAVEAFDTQENKTDLKLKLRFVLDEGVE